MIIRREHRVLGVFQKEEIASMIMDLNFEVITSVAILPQEIIIKSVEIRE